MAAPHQGLYDPQFVADLFDEMAETYGAVNYISSFGFCKRWREACVAMADINPGLTVYDLMTGMGECWPSIGSGLQGSGRLVALDISPTMCRRARTHIPQMDVPVQLHEQDMLQNTLPSGQADRVVSCFGLKTFSPEQRATLADEIARLLIPGGRFSLLEISVPPAPVLRAPYMFYLKYVIPQIGQLFLGNPDNYRLLGVYTERFGQIDTFVHQLQEAGLVPTRHRLFFGCATAVTGYKPMRN
jgi:demethylmenaquinone methyltransferase/2-methoxy-6-polyprenyl-1,4-benzoquinol methylase